MDARDAVTRLLREARDAPDESTGKLFEIVYKELRGLAKQMMARLPPNQTLQPTALVHEAFVRLVPADGSQWASRHHFFRTAARAMRFILVDQARRKSTAKHGARPSERDPDELCVELSVSPEDLLSVHEALEELERVKPRQARLVELRFFGGLTESETAEVLHLSKTSVAREWRYARYWLYGKVAGKRKGPET